MESRLPSSTRPGFVRQARGVLVDVGLGEGVEVGVRVGDIVAVGGVKVGVGWLGEQAESPPSSRSSAPICTIV